MDWRTWVYDRLDEDTNIAALVGDRIYSTLDGSPDERPFIVIRFSGSVPDVGDFQDVAIWVHDDPGSYVRIDTLLGLIRTKLVGPVAQQDAVAVVWQGDSPDLADDARGTVVRTASFRMAARSLV